jgi:hypothetical protein
VRKKLLVDNRLLESNNAELVQLSKLGNVGANLLLRLSVLLLELAGLGLVGEAEVGDEVVAEGLLGAGEGERLQALGVRLGAADVVADEGVGVGLAGDFLEERDVSGLVGVLELGGSELCIVS